MGSTSPVIPAKAGIQGRKSLSTFLMLSYCLLWIPAFAGMTEVKCVTPIRIETIAKLSPQPVTLSEAKGLWLQEWDSSLRSE